MSRRPDATTDLDEASGEGKENGEARTEDPSAFLRGIDEAADAYARRIFDLVFCRDIEKALGMEVRSSTGLSARIPQRSAAAT